MRRHCHSKIASQKSRVENYVYKEMWLTLVKYVLVYKNRASKKKFFGAKEFLHDFWFQEWLLKWI